MNLDDAYAICRPAHFHGLSTTTGTSTGGGITWVRTDPVDPSPYLALTKDTMSVPKPSPLPCPKCQGRAIRDSEGNDAVLELIDHDVSEDCAPTGTRARIRACEKCGHVWAGIVRVSEA